MTGITALDSQQGERIFTQNDNGLLNLSRHGSSQHEWMDKVFSTRSDGQGLLSMNGRTGSSQHEQLDRVFSTRMDRQGLLNMKGQTGSSKHERIRSSQHEWIGSSHINRHGNQNMVFSTSSSEESLELCNGCLQI